jgi:hypothetical protein
MVGWANLSSHIVEAISYELGLHALFTISCNASIVRINAERYMLD